jgi:Protein of unknown function (DUF3106)
MRSSCRWLTLLLALAAPVSLAAVEEAVQWKDLSAEEREVLGPFEDKWKSLSPQRQQRLRKGAARWQGLDANQRQQFKNRYQKWKDLPPEQKNKIRQRFQRFRALPESELRRTGRSRLLALPALDSILILSHSHRSSGAWQA